MSASEPSTVFRFRDALIECKRLYITAARECLRDKPDAPESARHDLIRRMVDLQKGLLIKIYTTVVKADGSWGRAERELAQELIDHVWGTRLEGDRLQQATYQMIQDAGSLKWYSLIRPFDQIEAMRSRVADLETVTLRVANLVAKADGRVTREETLALRTIQHELDIHLHRLPLDEPAADTPSTDQGHQAIEIIHQESTLLKQQEVGRNHLQDDVADEPADSLERAMADLQNLIGLEPVKEEITTLTNFLSLQHHREAAGLPQHELSLHMVFLGNPGTGKTTVARIVGRIFKAIGLLKKGHLIETDRSGLVAEYAGQTGPKTNRKIDEALDGILFIDEAYSLVSSNQEDAYGREAVQTLVKRMEDDRNRLIVILAGYPAPIEHLLHSNPGLTSRFNTQMHFDDYAPADLGRIFERMCQANQYQLPADTRAKLLIGFAHLYAHRDEHFGNGRLVRNTFENAVRNLANRVAAIAPVTRELLTVLTADDVRIDMPAQLAAKLEDASTRFAITCHQCHKIAHAKISQLGGRFRCPRCSEPIAADWGAPLLDE